MKKKNNNNLPCKCKFCGNPAPNNMQGYCQVCYRYFITEGKNVYTPPKYGEVAYAPNGDCICPECGKAFRKLSNHIYQAHGVDHKNACVKYGWHIRNDKVTNNDYRKHMHDIQHTKCITNNLIEKGKNTRFGGLNGNRQDIPHHSMRSRCTNCIHNTSYYCKAYNENCVNVITCTVKEIKNEKD